MKRLVPGLLAVALAGCSSIPATGPVVRGERIDVVRSDGYVRVIARPPSDGMSPEALVRGFLAASASVADGDDTARQYLTEPTSQQWRPAARTDVYDAGGLVVASGSGDTVRITAPLLGTIDARRRYHVAEPGAVVSEDLHVTRIDGQWRIDSVPRALYLEEGDVARSFRAHPVYFLDAEQDRLVPEYLMLTAGAGDLASAVAKAVISGPTSEGLSTAAGKGMRLLYGSMAMEYGSATIGLNRRAASLDLADRTRLLAQLTWSLTSLPNVNYVYVQVDGEGFGTDLGTGAHSRSDFSSYDPTRASQGHPLLYVRDDRIFSLLGGLPRLLYSADPAAEAAVSADGRTTMGVASSRRLLFVSIAGSAGLFVATGADLASPTMLSSGEGWFLDRESKGGLHTWDVRDGVLPVITGLPARARILDFAIAPDESRIAVIVNDGATTTVRIGNIVRTSDGAEVTDLARVEQRLTSAAAVAWAAEDQLVVLGAVGAIAVQPIGVSLPLGTLTLFGGPANAVSLAAVPGAPMVVGDQAGQLWQYEDSKWSASELGLAPNYAR